MTTAVEKAEVSDVLARLATAVRDKDRAALEALHDIDAVIFDLAPPLGKIFAAPPLIEWLGKWDAPVDETWADAHIEVEGDLAVCHGYVRTRTRQGGDEVVWWMRRTMALRRGPEGWRIVHDHTSVPFYMDGSDRAALDLSPVDNEPAGTQAGAK